MKLCSIAVYETTTHFYVIGSDASDTRFHALKIDRTSPKSFVVGEPDHTYSKADIGELLATVSSSSIVTSSEDYKRNRTGHRLLRTVDKAYGIIGAIRFLEGFYLLVITKARVVAIVGCHAVYKIEDVSMIYIPATGPSTNPDEMRYAKLFQSVDLTTNFYFSYTYDLSHTIQENTLAAKGVKWNKNSYSPAMSAEKKFVWNEYLLTPFKDNDVSSKWTLEIIHGYIDNRTVELPCTKLTITLIGRRSAVFAGTRFLKRGTNFEGAVANDVETEQIVWDMSSTPTLETGKFTAFVQRRGSVPLFWSQDPATRGVVGKPPIFVDLVEPNALTTAAHFRELRRKYGHPIVIMNLVKRREKRHGENVLHEQFLKNVRYLNQFRKPGRCLDYICFDVAKCNKTGQVLQRLEQLGTRSITKNGWFQSFPQLHSRESEQHPMLAQYQPLYAPDGSTILQHGISRTNCVDCLDRTNVAQFGIGKVALGCQLHAMGYVEDPNVPITSELCRVFEELFDEHGDTMAWQYAGSQLVHSIKTYKKISAFQERSRDVIQTISRYYSNTFSDYEKQNGINVFLGVFRPDVHGKPHLWDLPSDRYLHFPTVLNRKNEFLRWATNVSSDTEDESEEWIQDWLEEKAEEARIRLSNDFVSTSPRDTRVRKFSRHSEEPDLYSIVHRTFELTSFDQLIREANASRKTVSLNALNQSAFQTTSFMKLFKTSEPAVKKLADNKPVDLSPEEEDEDDDEPTGPEDDDVVIEEDLNPESSVVAATFHPSLAPPTRLQLSVSTGLRTTQEIYGFELSEPHEADMLKYRRYVQLAEVPPNTEVMSASENDGTLESFCKLQPLFEFTPSFFTVDSSFHTDLRRVSDKSLEIFKEVANKAKFDPPTAAVRAYREYAPSTKSTPTNSVSSGSRS